MGVIQNSQWFWYQLAHYPATLNEKPFALLPERGVRYEETAAFDTAEVGEILPEFFVSYRFYKPNDSKPYWACYNDGNDEIRVEDGTEADTEAEARGLMLAYLLENDIVKVEEVNERLGQ